MKRILFLSITTLFFLFAGLFGQNNSAEKSNVTVSWEEFKKLLNLDENHLVIPLMTFQKMLEQTGTKTVPTYSVKEGNVILSREEFQKLVSQMKPPADPLSNPPFEYLITKAIYSGKMGKSTTKFTGTFDVQVLKKEGFLRIPLLPQSIALEDLKVGGARALVVSEGGYHKIVLNGSGEYRVTALFSMKSTLDKGPHKVDLAIQQTPITLLELELPLKDVDVEIPQAQQVLSSLKGNSTMVSAILAPGRTISIRWRKKVPVTEKVPPKLYAEVYHLISIEDDALKINSDIVYNILHSEVDAVRIIIPTNMNVLNVTGEGVGEWQEVEQNGQRLILIPFTYGKKGSVAINVFSEAQLSENGIANAFSGFQVLDCVRETGFIGVELNTSAEVILTESDGLEKIAVQKLPHRLFNKSVKPLLFGFKYLKHLFTMVLDVKKHQKIAVPMATVNSANAVTLFTEDGKIVHRIIYQVRNSAKQFLEIKLPKDADVWSVFVGNQPVESSLNSQGKLLVPLIRSKSVNNQLDTFPVEIIYALVQDRFSWLGSRGSTLPEIDLIISQLMWSVYLPDDFKYNYFSSTLEKEEIIRGVNFLSNTGRRYDAKKMRDLSQTLSEEPSVAQADELRQAYSGKESESRFRNVPMEEKQIAGQMKAEMDFGGRMEGLVQQSAPSSSTGVLPIQIKIPIGGQVYRFAKTIIKSDDPLTFEVFYSSTWMNSVLMWTILVVIILILLLNRKRFLGLFNWVKNLTQAIINYFKKNESTIKNIAQSRMTPFVLFGLLIVAWALSLYLLTVLMLFLLWVSIVYLILNYRRKKVEEKTMVEPVMVEKPKTRKKKTDNTE